MAPQAGTEPRDELRVRLSRKRVLRAAVGLADRDGLEALTMRGLAQELGVEAMSLYHHVANKGAILDGATEVVVEEISDAADEVERSVRAEDWKASLRGRILAAREVMLSHPWAPRLLATRNSLSAPMIRYFDRTLGVLLAGGFSYDLAHQALHALGSRIMGFTQELFDPVEPDEAAADTTAMLEQMSDEFPHLVAMLGEIAHDDPDSTLGWCDDQAEFEFGLDLILDGLERRRAAA